MTKYILEKISRMYPQELAMTTENRVKGLIEIKGLCQDSFGISNGRLSR